MKILSSGTLKNISIFFSMYCSTSNSASTFIDKLSDIEDSYDIFIIDMVGVICDEKHPLPGAIDASLSL